MALYLGMKTDRKLRKKYTSFFDRAVERNAGLSLLKKQFTIGYKVLSDGESDVFMVRVDIILPRIYYLGYVLGLLAVVLRSKITAIFAIAFLLTTYLFSKDYYYRQACKGLKKAGLPKPALLKDAGLSEVLYNGTA